MMIGPPSVSLSAATTSSERRMVVLAPVVDQVVVGQVVQTTYFGIAL
jgi:hypothetical protein